MSLHERTLKKALLQAAEDGDLGQVRHLVEDRGVSPLLANSDGWTAVHFSVMRGHCDVMMYLVARGASVTHSNIRGMTPLHLAVFHDHTSIVRALMTAGASSTLHQEDNDGNTPHQWLYGADSGGSFDSADNFDYNADGSNNSERCHIDVIEAEKAAFSKSSSDNDSSDGDNEPENEDRVSNRGDDTDDIESCMLVSDTITLERSTLDEGCENISDTPAEVAWMNSMMSSMLTTSDEKMNTRIITEQRESQRISVDDDDWSESQSSSSMSESDLAEFYKNTSHDTSALNFNSSEDAGRKDGMDEAHDEGHCAGTEEENFIGQGGYDFETGDLMNSCEERCYTYTTGGVVYDWSSPLKPTASSPPSIVSTERNDAVRVHVQDTNDRDDEETGKTKEAEKEVNNEDYCSRVSIAEALSVVMFMRKQNIVDSSSAGILKEQIFSGDKKVMNSLQQFLFCVK